MADHESATASTQQAQADAAYTEVPYELGVYRDTWPDRLYTVARLAGVAAPPIETARVLEVGGGAALNALALAAAYPGVQVTSIDLNPDAVAQGRRWADAAGLTNITIACEDLTAPQSLADEYDYITAHGVYAWVPPSVADALLALIGRRLAPTGVAYVSYNALPGAYARLAIRDRALRAAASAGSPRERLALGRAALAGLDPQSASPLVAAIARLAAPKLDPADTILLHDEMGACYHPSYVADVVARAGAHGLGYLGDATPGRLGEMFDGSEDRVAAAMDRDWETARGFRETLLVRAAVPVGRAADVDALRQLWLCATMAEPAPGVFKAGEASVEIGDAALQGALRHLIAVAPARVRAGALGLDDARLGSVLRLCDEAFLALHAGPAPFTLDPGPAPQASAAARLAVAERLPFLPTLDGGAVRLDPATTKLIAACDGSGSAAPAAALAAQGVVTAAAQAAALRDLARTRLLLPEPG